MLIIKAGFLELKNESQGMPERSYSQTLKVNHQSPGQTPTVIYVSSPKSGHRSASKKHESNSTYKSDNYERGSLKAKLLLKSVDDVSRSTPNSAAF